MNEPPSGTNGVTAVIDELPSHPQHVWVGIIESGGQDNQAFSPDETEKSRLSEHLPSHIPPPLSPPPPSCKTFPDCDPPSPPSYIAKSTIGLTDKVGDGLTPKTKQELQEIMNINAGILRAGTSGIILERLSLSNFDFQTRRFSTVAMEMLREREDCDLHPYGRGGRFEGFLYDARRVKVNTDHSKLFTWLLFFFSLVLLSGSIIYLAEMDRQRHLHAYYNRTLSTSTTAPNTTLPATGTPST